MKVLIIGMLGAGKSSLAFDLSRKYNLRRLNLDEICRSPQTGEYFPQETQIAETERFAKEYRNWVMEGCQKYLYERVSPDLVINMKISRLRAVWRFTTRFFKAKKLLDRYGPGVIRGREDEPVQPYHYRKPTLRKILEWDRANREIESEIESFLRQKGIKAVEVKSFKDYKKVYEILDKDKTCKKSA